MKAESSRPFFPLDRSRRCVLLAGIWLFLPTLLLPLRARDLRVGIDPDVPTIAHGIRLAVPGDTIHLEPGKVYRDYAGFHGKKGEPGKPITLDGHGATLDGCDPLVAGDWTEVGAGLFSHSSLLPRLNEAMLGRWFFLWDGEVRRMGRTSKARSEPFKDPENLAPGEWTFVRDSLPDSPSDPARTKEISGTFFLRLAPGRALAEESVFVPVRSAGVQFGGDNRHLVIRNVTARNPYNDGFNIHGHCEDVLFENITALGCGDDGISAHGTAQYRVKGFVSIGNSTGICDTGAAVTDYEDVFIADCASFDLYFLDHGRYSLKNAVVLSSAQNPFSVIGRKEGECRLRLENVFFRRLVEPRTGIVSERAFLAAERCTIEGLTFRTEGSATWKDCLLEEVPASADTNGADLTILRPLIPSSHSL